MPAATVDDLLLHADDLVLSIQAEASRIVDEANAAGLVSNIFVFGGVIGDVLGLDEQADNWDALPQQALAFTDDRYPRLRDQAAATGDLALAHRLVDSAQGILTAMTGVGPLDDTQDNALQFVRDVNKEFASKLLGYPVFVGGGAAAGVALALVAAPSPRAALAGAVGGAVAGAVVRYVLGQLVIPVLPK